jgi:hypothetical protein
MEKSLSLLLPEAALLSDMQGRYVLVVNHENTVEQRRVQVGVQEGSLRVVLDGVAPGDKVIVRGVLKARPGAKVTPKDEAEVAKEEAASKASAKEAPPKEAGHKEAAPKETPAKGEGAEKKGDEKKGADSGGH